jgi:Asp/Glu/hydantoin racemase
VTARLVTESSHDVLAPLLEASHQLIDRGAEIISTSCGFLVRYQRDLAERLPVPVVTSSLVALPFLKHVLPGGSTIGVLTFNEATLNGRYLETAGLPADIVVAGLPVDGAFRQDILGGSAASSRQRYEEAHATLAALLLRAPGIAAVVVECTNIVPYSKRLAAAFGLPFFDIISTIEWIARAGGKATPMSRAYVDWKT